MADLKKTPLADAHVQLGAKMAPFGGWLMPIQYSDIIAEHRWTRTSCSVFDICHMGELMVYGSLEASKLNTIVTPNLATMKTGACRYGFMLNSDGGIIDDLITYKVSDTQWMLVVNAATTDNDYAHISCHIAAGARCENISAAVGKLDIQGPLASQVVRDVLGVSVERLDYYTFDRFIVRGESSIISRTGYTGELGYEIYFPAGKIDEIWNALLHDERVKPAGLGARDTLRLEMCYPLYGHDITQNTLPSQTDFDKCVDLTKDFIGKSALEKKMKQENRRIAYFMSESRRAPREGYAVYVGDRAVGTVTSGSFSPSLTRGIAIGYIEAALAKPGTNVMIKNGTISIAATTTEKPFYKDGSARTNQA